jgi:hypothetical protein
VTCQLLDVMDAAHARGIVHRDIKPANLFVLRDGRVKVLDFGIARLRDAAAGIKSTRAGVLIGTPGFMAPEQALAQGHEVDPRTDIWAIGATLFTMISRRPVHEGNNARQILIRAATTPAPSLARVAPHTPRVVVEIVARALELEKIHRWESAAVMREAVARAHQEAFGALRGGDLESLLEHGGRADGGAPARFFGRGVDRHGGRGRAGRRPRRAERRGDHHREAGIGPEGRTAPVARAGYGVRARRGCGCRTRDDGAPKADATRPARGPAPGRLHRSGADRHRDSGACEGPESVRRRSSLRQCLQRGGDAGAALAKRAPGGCRVHAAARVAADGLVDGRPDR